LVGLGRLGFGLLGLPLRLPALLPLLLSALSCRVRAVAWLRTATGARGRGPSSHRGATTILVLLRQRAGVLPLCPELRHGLEAGGGDGAVLGLHKHDPPEAVTIGSFQ